MNAHRQIDLVLPVANLRPSFRARLVLRMIAARDPLARLRAGDELELYYEAGDLHSQLCAAYARRLLQRLRRTLRIRLVSPPPACSYPKEARQRAFAASDAARLAPCYGLPAPMAVPTGQRAALEARLTAAGDDSGSFLVVESECLSALASCASLPPVAAASQASTQALLRANAARREKLGHYLPAMWQFGGEWFLALDRLAFLHARLRAAAALADDRPLVQCNADALPLPRHDTRMPLEFWFSFRSSYSYLTAVELTRRCARGLHADLRVRPVLPMVMRGLPVPRAKRLYIVRDVQRCADALAIPFGQIHDPVGDGVLRLLTLFPDSASSDQQLRYCVSAGQAVWAEGLDVRRDDALRCVIERSGLDWSAAQRRLAAGIDTRAAEAHREALFAVGLWGVPSFRCGDFTTWGRDRLWMLDQIAYG